MLMYVDVQTQFFLRDHHNMSYNYQGGILKQGDSL